MIKITESHLVTAIGKYLQVLENQGKLLYQRNNTGAMKIGSRYVRFGKKGSADIVVYLPQSKVMFLECKSETGKQSGEQKAFQIRALRLGYEYYIVRSLEETIRRIGL